MPGMTHEERATWIRRIFVLLLATGVIAGAWFYRKTEPPLPPPPVASTSYDMEIVHYHEPGNADSTRMAESLNQIGKKYAMQVLVTRVDIAANPALAKTRGINRTPHVSMMTDGQEAFAFQGVWPQADIESKVEEILRGLKRVGKDWRPAVKGMQPMHKSAPLSPVPPSQP